MRFLRVFLPVAIMICVLTSNSFGDFTDYGSVEAVKIVKEGSNNYLCLKFLRHTNASESLFFGFVMDGSPISDYWFSIIMSHLKAASGDKLHQIFIVAKTAGSFNTGGKNYKKIENIWFPGNQTSIW